MMVLVSFLFHFTICPLVSETCIEKENRPFEELFYKDIVYVLQSFIHFLK